MYVGTVRRQILFSRVELKTRAKDALRVSYWKAFVVSLVVVVLVAFAFRIFLGYSFEVGGRKFFIEQDSSNVDMSYLGYSFNGRYYFDIVKGMLYKEVINFLWFLLLIIPGIIKYYAYIMIPYILAENPKIGSKRAMELSEEMTSGEKFDMFVLDLSFIGWYLLGTLALGVGILFVNPYYNATYAELYLELKNKAITNGFTDSNELIYNK